MKGKERREKQEMKRKRVNGGKFWIRDECEKSKENIRGRGKRDEEEKGVKNGGSWGECGVERVRTLN